MLTYFVVKLLFRATQKEKKTVSVLTVYSLKEDPGWMRFDAVCVGHFAKKIADDFVSLFGSFLDEC